MFVKILKSSCYVEVFHQEGNAYIKKLCHFYCHCKEEHVYYVHTCTCHPLVHRRMQGMHEKCSCKFLGPYEVCNFCVQVTYLLNFRAYKICMKKRPKNVRKNLVSLDIFLKDNTNMC